MARKLRIPHPGTMDHVMNRGDRRGAIFEDDEDRQRLLDMASWFRRGVGLARALVGGD